MGGKSGLKNLLLAFGLEETEKRPCSFAFSSKVVPSSWKAYFFDLPSRLPFYFVSAPNGRVTEIRSLVSGIKAENFVLLTDLGEEFLLVLRRSQKGEKSPLIIPLRREEDFERVINVVKKFNFVSDQLSAHSSISSVIDLLSEGAAERFFVNRGLFSNYFLRERLSGCLSERGRSPSKESGGLLSKVGGEFPTAAEDVAMVLSVLGYELEQLDKPGYSEYDLNWRNVSLDVSCVVAPVESLDVKTRDKVAPSYQAVSALRRKGWVILTNGRLWRLYSGRISSSSTNYFELDLEGIVDEANPKLVFFVSLFSSSSFMPRKGVTDVELVFEGGLKYAKEIEDDLRAKVFDNKLFLNLVSGILDYSASKKYTKDILENAKTSGLKLLYRLLFILYAESRGLLPVENTTYQEISFESLRVRLSAFEKQPEDTSLWDCLKRLFRAVGDGDLDANVPEYDGVLFEEDSKIDGLLVRNKFLAPALRDLMEVNGKGIDYQNLGVQHLGSLYEALLDYSVFQAEQDLVIYKDEILDAEFAADLKQKPRGFMEKGELYLSVGGLARKRTGSYYTSEPIVQFLVRKGLEVQFKLREDRFRADLERFRASKKKDSELARKCTEDLLGLKVIDPAMGSGHFLVVAVDEITHWIIDLVEENPDAPLVLEIEEYRMEIIEEQRKRGIRLNEDLLTDSVILKRLVMKRCVYGVDINPLAVELAKLSLWLDSFTIGTPLTFLDHHIRCGDSLIGLWLKDVGQRAFDTTLDSWMKTVDSVGTTLFEDVSLPVDLTVEQVRKSRTTYEGLRNKTEPLRTLLDVVCAEIINPEVGKRLPRNIRAIKEVSKKKSKPKWWKSVEEALEVARKYQFFHWELEFPDAFGKEMRGFDLIVMNPPWDAVKPEDDDFFSVYEPKYRRLKKPEKQKTMKRILKDPCILKVYNEYRQSIASKGSFYKNSKQYEKRGIGDIDLWKLFLERSLGLQAAKGSLAILIPSALVTAKGGRELREALFQTKIRAMFEFENRKGIFQDVHRSYKFVLLVSDKSEPTDLFPAAFYLHDIESLQGKAEKEKFIEMSISFVKSASPESYSIPEARSSEELQLLKRVYSSNPLLLAPTRRLSVSFIREDLQSKGNHGWPVFAGKNFHQFVLDFLKTDNYLDPSEGLRKTAKHREYNSINRQFHEKARLAFRGVSSGTNVRTMIAAILPPKSFVSQKATLVLPKWDGKFTMDDAYYRMTAYLCGLFNSLVFDFLLRTRIYMNINYFYVFETPLPDNLDDNTARSIIKLAGRLSCCDDRFNHLAAALDIEIAPITIGERIRLLTELNALVAKHYGLTRNELELVLKSFEGFKEDEKILKINEVHWDNKLIRKFNGEVRKRVLPFFDELNSGNMGERN